MTTPITQSDMDDIFIKIAERHCAYADSAPCIRGRDDIVAFARAVLTQTAPAVRNEYNVDLHASITEAAKRFAKDFWQRQKRSERYAVGGAPERIKYTPGEIPSEQVVITDTMAIHETFERDEQCSPFDGVPMTYAKEPHDTFAARQRLGL